MAVAYKDLKSCESVRNLLRKINRDAREKEREARLNRLPLRSKAPDR